MKRVLLCLLAVVVVALVAAVPGFRFWFQSVYLPSERCRQWLNQSASRALEARGEFMPLQTSPGAIYSDGFVAFDGPCFRRLQLDQIRGEVRFGLLSRTCTVDHLEINRLRLELAGVVPGPNPTLRPAPAILVSQASRVEGGRLSVRQVTINNLELAGEGLSWKGTRWMAHSLDEVSINGPEWLANGLGGTVTFGSSPEWRVETVDARFRGKSVFLTGAKLRMKELGEASLDGEFAPGDPAKVRVTFSGVPAVSYLPEDWRARLTGDVSGSLTSTLTDGGVQTAEGKLMLLDGELTALPVLDQIATLTRTDGFRRMRLQKCSANIEKSKGGLAVSQLVMESEGLLRAEGGFFIKAGQIEGVLQVGVAPSALQWIPGATERVFTVARDGYLWTPVRISGAAEHPDEDLTVRLAAAATGKAIDEVTGTVRDTANGLLDLVAPLLPVTPVVH